MYSNTEGIVEVIGAVRYFVGHEIGPISAPFYHLSLHVTLRRFDIFRYYCFFHALHPAVFLYLTCSLLNVPVNSSLKKVANKSILKIWLYTCISSQNFVHIDTLDF